jgi:hypothetical protein
MEATPEMPMFTKRRDRSASAHLRAVVHSECPVDLRRADGRDEPADPGAIDIAAPAPSPVMATSRGAPALTPSPASLASRVSPWTVGEEQTGTGQ